MHAAQAPAERATFVDLQIGPFPNSEKLGNGVAIMSDDLEGVGVLGNETIAAGTDENGQNVRRLDSEPLSANMGRSKVLVEVPLKLEGVGRVDPPEQPQLQRVAGLEVALARLDVLRNPDLDRGASIFVLANEIDRHVALPAPSPEPIEQHVDHLLI